MNIRYSANIHKNCPGESKHVLHILYISITYGKFICMYADIDIHIYIYFPEELVLNLLLA